MTGRLTDINELSMLRENSKTKQDEILWISTPTSGCSYQMIAAMQRLGIKCCVPDSEISKIKPLQALNSAELSNSPATAALFEIHSETELTNLKTELTKNGSQLKHAVALVPQHLSSELTQNLLDDHKNLTLIFHPQLVGFKDQFFFEDAVTALRTKNGLKWEKIKKNTSPFDFVFLSDLCGFLISILWETKFFQKSLLTPSTQLNPQEVLSELEAELEFSTTFFERLGALVASRSSNKNSPPTLKPGKPANAENILDWLPTTITSTKIWIKKVARQLEHDPESDLHFPPARTP